MEVYFSKQFTIKIIINPIGVVDFIFLTPSYQCTVLLLIQEYLTVTPTFYAIDRPLVKL